MIKRIVLLLLLCFEITVSGQEKKPGQILVSYKSELNVTSVSIVPITLSRTPTDILQFSVMGVYSGRVPMRPEILTLLLIETSKTHRGNLKDVRAVAVIADKERYELDPTIWGRNEQGETQSIGANLKYGNFQKILVAKRVLFRLDGREIELKPEHVKALKDLATSFVPEQ